MNKLIQTAPPSELARWLGRSMAWTLACIAGFVPVIYWPGGIGYTSKTSQVLSLVWLTFIQLLAWKKGIGGFNLAYHNSYYPAKLWMKSLALSWLTVLLFALVVATLLCVFGWLVLNSSRSAPNPHSFSC